MCKIKKYILISLLLFFGSVVFAQQLGDFIYSEEDQQDSLTQSHEIGLQLYYLQIQIGEHQLDLDSPLIQEDAFVLISQSNDLVSYPLLENMRATVDKTVVYDQYLSSLEQQLYKINAFQSQLYSEMVSLKSDISLCQKAKSTANTLYQSALDDATPTTNIDSILHDIQKSTTCIADKTAILQTKSSMYDLIEDKTSILSSKYTYLASHRGVILDNFGLLDANYLENVIELQEELKGY